MERIKTKYHGITRKMIRIFIEDCDKCKEKKKIVREEPDNPIISNYPRERVLIDLITMNKFNKNFNIPNDQLYHYVLTIIDHYSNHTIIYPQKTKTETETAKNVANYIRLFGIPHIIQADNGTEFVNKVIKNLYNEYKIKEVHSSPYHPQANSKVERYNRFIKTCIQGYMAANKGVYWNEFTDRVIERINTNICRRTKCKPRSLFYMDIRELIKENREFNAVIKNENCVDKDGRVELHCVYDDNNDNNNGDNDDDYINISDDDEEDYLYDYADEDDCDNYNNNNDFEKVDKDGKYGEDDGYINISDDDDDDDGYVSVNDSNYYEELDEETEKEYDDYSKSTVNDMIKFKNKLTKIKNSVSERVNEYNNKMIEDSKKKIHNKNPIPEEGDIVIVSVGKKNDPINNTKGIVKVDIQNKKKYIMYIYKNISLIITIDIALMMIRYK